MSRAFTFYCEDFICNRILWEQMMKNTKEFQSLDNNKSNEKVSMFIQVKDYALLLVVFSSASVTANVTFKTQPWPGPETKSAVPL